MKNSDVAHNWVYARYGDHGQSYNGNLWYRGTKIYSYQTLMGINNSDGVVFLNTNRYSTTTSKHQSYIRRATSHLPRVCMQSASLDPKDEIPLIIKDLDNMIKAPIKSQQKLYDAKTLSNNIHVLSHFGYFKLTDEVNDKYLKLQELIFEGEKYINAKANKIATPNIEKINKAIKNLEDVSSMTFLEIYESFKNLNKKDRVPACYKALDLSLESAKGDQLFLNRDFSLLTSKDVTLSTKEVALCVELAKQYFKGENDNLKGRHINIYTILDVKQAFVQIGCHTILRDTLKVLLRDYELITKDNN